MKNLNGVTRKLKIMTALTHLYFNILLDLLIAIRRAFLPSPRSAGPAQVFNDFNDAVGVFTRDFRHDEMTSRVLITGKSHWWLELACGFGHGWSAHRLKPHDPRSSCLPGNTLAEPSQPVTLIYFATPTSYRYNVTYIALNTNIF